MWTMLWRRASRASSTTESTPRGAKQLVVETMPKMASAPRSAMSASTAGRSVVSCSPTSAFCTTSGSKPALTSDLKHVF
jgi:hypothetical protein